MSENIILWHYYVLKLLFSENPTIYGLTFFDAGNVWQNFDYINTFKLNRSVGFGIRLFIPMLGIIGYDIGYGFDSSAYGNENQPWGWDHHLIFGGQIN